MNGPSDLDRVVTDWLHADATTAGSDRVLAAALVRVSTVSQVRRTPVTRFARMDAFAGLAASAAAVLVVAVAGMSLLPAGGESAGGGAAASPSLMPAKDPDGDLSGRRSLTVDGVPLSFSLPADSSLPWPWESLKDDLYIANSTVLGQAAEAIILWTSFPDSRHARPCLLDPSAGSSAVDLAAAVATAPGTELVSGPSDVTVGGLAAKQVMLTVGPLGRSSGWYDAEGRTVGCDPAYFYGWDPYDAGAFWFRTVPGDAIQVWIVEVGGKLLFIEAETKPDAGSAVEQEIGEIIESIRFE